MSKIVMPKNSAILEEIKASMQIYYEENNWLTNDVYTPRLMRIIGDGQDRSAYTKKAQIPAYFGFLEWQDITNNRSPRRLTNLGRKFYEDWVADDKDRMYEDIMVALETTVFGRNNFGCPDSDSDIEPPVLIIRGIMDLEYMTKAEMVVLLWFLEDSKANYTETIRRIRNSRSEYNSSLIEGAPTYYSDNKPITMLVRWGFLNESSFDSRNFVIAPEIREKYESRLKSLQIFNVDKCSQKFDYVPEPNESKKTTPASSSSVKTGENIILYGVPGCGKSHKIKTRYCDDENYMERVVFHPDYSYSDFVGQILPRNTDGNISYPFIPGPFTRVLKKAILDTKNNYYLVIEELNRGNAPAIFGEIFQLLDRKNGESEYAINNADISKEIFDEDNHPIKIPSNLFLLATMNTADQNVFTLDTAFKRRWKMRSIENNVGLCSYSDNQILDTNVTWKEFVTKINREIVAEAKNSFGSDDKRLGAYFIEESDLLDPDYFAEKVIMYLYSDAFKFHPENVFKKEYDTLEDLICDFKKNKMRVFKIEFEKTISSEDINSADAETLYFEGKNITSEIRQLYDSTMQSIRARIPDVEIGTVGTKQYLNLKSNNITKKSSFATLKVQKKLLLFETEIPYEIEQYNDIGECIAIDGHHKHYYQLRVMSEEDIELAIQCIVEAYNSLKDNQ